MNKRDIRLLARIIFLSVVAVSATSAAELNKAGERIIGGEPIAIDKAPYMVQLKNSYGLFFCGGTLISKQFVVTAAHCLNGHTYRGIRVVAGATLVDGEPGVERKLENYWIPPEYKKGSAHMDVAVLKLETPFKRSRTIRPVKMCKAAPEPGKTISVTGWGRTKQDSTKRSNTLQYIDIPTLSTEECIKRHEKLATKITDTMFCASQPGIKDSCGGDSGGPALFEGQLCGIVSWGKGCARSDYPGVYTSIPVVRKFIEESLLK